MRFFSKYYLIGAFLLIWGPFAMAEPDLISPKEAAEMSAENEAVIIDVREYDEWDKHHIQGAIHIPLGQINERLSELEPYKNSPIITQCRSGKRSAKAQAKLKLAGFTKVYSMDGGIQAWDEEGLATE